MAPSKLVLISGGVATYLGGSMLLYAYMRPKGSAPDGFGAGSDTTGIWNGLASSYDDRIDFDESVVGIKMFRRALLWGAKGKVLEVSTGTGRNLPYYRSGVESVLMTDRSINMLAQAKAKAIVAYENTDKLQKYKFQVADVREWGGLGSTRR